MARKTYVVRWTLDVPRMVSELGGPQAREIERRFRGQNEASGRNVRTRRISERVDPQNVPRERRKVHGVSKVSVDDEGAADGTSINREIMPYLSVDDTEETSEPEDADREIDRLIESSEGGS